MTFDVPLRVERALVFEHQGKTNAHVIRLWTDSVCAAPLEWTVSGVE
jgi:hypothetical protein